MSLTVYKLGGSLLDLADLGERLRRVVPADVRPLFVVGGGPTANVVRVWDRVHRLGQERAHWLALRSLQLNEALLCELRPEAVAVASRDDAAAVWREGGWAVLSAYDFVRAEEPGARLPLPHSWEATSDSVAAWIAALWPADRLVLLKSVGLPETQGVTDDHGSAPGATNGHGFTGGSEWVDENFREIAREVATVEWVNLRDDAPVVRRMNVGPRPSPRETVAPPPC